ncbi:MAG: leucine-rich repeat domain-containing protein, partial [Candidatus Methanomethylophilaceae archaeon]|nr:leucine-rich repeat domain-containing protein [Candidatus Methanomethylophilaceae archaeon]
MSSFSHASPLRKALLGVVVLAAVLAVAASVLSPVPASDAASSGTCGDGLTWALDDYKNLTISGSGPMSDYSSSGGPWGKWLESVAIEDGVTSIGNWAFYDCFFSSVSIPSSVTSIGGDAFYDCTSLTSVDMPSVTSIGSQAFGNCT